MGRFQNIKIVWKHGEKIGNNDDRPFLSGWYYVEFFFIITGFFTMRRFFHEDAVDGTERVRTALTYTFHKFVKFLPYTTGGGNPYNICCK